LPKIDSLAAQIWTHTTLPPIKQMERNMNLFITNTLSATMYLLSKIKCLMIEAAGLHLVPPKPLPKVRLKQEKNRKDATIHTLKTNI
jgi:hypothetical protein